MAKKPTTEPATPHQNLGKMFPDWRLPKGVKNASNEELEASESACESWGWRGAMLLMAGLIAEVILTAWAPDHTSIAGRWGTVFATILVALGVGAEVQFARMGARRQGELTRRSNDRVREVEFANGYLEERIAMANERAATADLARVELETKLASRRLSKKQSDKLTTALASVKDRIPSLILLRLRDAEAWAFAVDIAVAIQNSGITYEMRDRTASSLMVYGIKIVDTADGAIAEAFAGVELGPIEYAVNNANDDQGSIVVGLKPPPL